MNERIIAFNYRTLYMTKEERLDLHKRFVVDHYLKQFNEETIETKQQKNCGEPCVAVCKKMHNHFKKDYEPYQTMGPLCGVFDQRAAELLNGKADSYGFDAISVSPGRAGWYQYQYWTHGVLSPMAIMGKYYMVYGKEFIPPHELGRQNAERMIKELMMDNLGFCRFHRAWAEDIMPDVMEKLYGQKDNFLKKLQLTATRINSRNASIFWESERNVDFVYRFLKKKMEEDSVDDKELEYWILAFEKDKFEAGLQFWYDIHKGVHESLREFY